MELHDGSEENMNTNEELIDVNNNVRGEPKETFVGQQSMPSNTMSERLIKLYQTPKCKLPPASEMAAIEKFVENAMKSQETRTDDRINKPDSSHSEGYNAILKALKRPNDPMMVCKVLLALRTAGMVKSIINSQPNNSGAENTAQPPSMPSIKFLHWTAANSAKKTVS